MQKIKPHGYRALALQHRIFGSCKGKLSRNSIYKFKFSISFLHKITLSCPSRENGVSGRDGETKASNASSSSRLYSRVPSRVGPTERTFRPQIVCEGNSLSPVIRQSNQRWSIGGDCLSRTKYPTSCSILRILFLRGSYFYRTCNYFWLDDFCPKIAHYVAQVHVNRTLRL